VTPEELKRRFKYRAPDAATRDLHESVRANTIDFATYLERTLPGDSREKSLAFTAFEEAMFWAHAHIARNVSPPEE